MNTQISSSWPASMLSDVNTSSLIQHAAPAAHDRRLTPALGGRARGVAAAPSQVVPGARSIAPPQHAGRTEPAQGSVGTVLHRARPALNDALQRLRYILSVRLAPQLVAAHAALSALQRLRCPLCCRWSPVPMTLQDLRVLAAIESVLLLLLRRDPSDTALLAANYAGTGAALRCSCPPPDALTHRLATLLTAWLSTPLPPAAAAAAALKLGRELKRALEILDSFTRGLGLFTGNDLYPFTAHRRVVGPDAARLQGVVGGWCSVRALIELQCCETHSRLMRSDNSAHMAGARSQAATLARLVLVPVARRMAQGWQEEQPGAACPACRAARQARQLSWQEWETVDDEEVARTTTRLLQHSSVQMLDDRLGSICDQVRIARLEAMDYPMPCELPGLGDTPTSEEYRDTMARLRAVPPAPVSPLNLSGGPPPVPAMQTRPVRQQVPWVNQPAPSSSSAPTPALPSWAQPQAPTPAPVPAAPRGVQSLIPWASVSQRSSSDSGPATPPPPLHETVSVPAAVPPAGHDRLSQAARRPASDGGAVPYAAGGSVQAAAATAAVRVGAAAAVATAAVAASTAVSGASGAASVAVAAAAGVAAVRGGAAAPGVAVSASVANVTATTSHGSTLARDQAKPPASAAAPAAASASVSAQTASISQSAAAAAAAPPAAANGTHSAPQLLPSAGPPAAPAVACTTGTEALAQETLVGPVRRSESPPAVPLAVSVPPGVETDLVEEPVQQPNAPAAPRGLRKPPKEKIYYPKTFYS